MRLRDKIFFDRLKAVYDKKKYKIDLTSDLNINIFGIRRNETRSNSFDDMLGIFYPYGDDIVLCTFEATTDPGAYWLKNPMHPKGTAILCPGQYLKTWRLGKHQGKYEALVQVKPVKVWRDNNKDTILDFAGQITMEGYFGINIHASNPYSESYLVEKWSAGCQVFKRISDYDVFMAICLKASKIYGDHFTYTLFEEEDFL